MRDADDLALLDEARRNHWRPCPQCHHMIELFEGCRHMTCKCGFEFCYTCGTPWEREPGQARAVQKCECMQRAAPCHAHWLQHGLALFD